ncbi:general transcription and DNA repair factor IIH helicase subunit XPD-like [Vicia villosa]|uniref:general transcription and DNA repair factor IIH helicase subunit XPD-like n=1 Tax=Vicia villosa TaxID=3911 RepID=UPI00273C6052|nr:general transcription and DNA repair factor IIH helicase subunit XPD-like [Vicia villosa]
MITSTMLCCHDASLAIRHVLERFQSVVITSGTLNPINLYPCLLNFEPVVILTQWKEINQCKLVFFETQDVVETTLALYNYRKACDCGRGAIFFTIAREFSSMHSLWFTYSPQSWLIELLGTLRRKLYIPTPSI